jgi:aspergillopepsin I
MVVAYYAQVTGAYQQSDGSWAFPCTATLPSFTFGVGTSQLTVSGSVLSFSQISASDCYGGIQATSETGYAIFGTNFFDSLFIVHDVANNRVGFAQRASLS